MSRKQAILEFITQHIQRNGYAPTVREIAEAVGLKSSSTVAGHLKRLKAKGLIQWEPYEVRTLRLMDEETQNQPPVVLKSKRDVPTVIQWQGRQYVHDPG